MGPGTNWSPHDPARLRQAAQSSRSVRDVLGRLERSAPNSGIPLGVHGDFMVFLWGVDVFLGDGTSKNLLVFVWLYSHCISILDGEIMLNP